MAAIFEIDDREIQFIAALANDLDRVVSVRDAKIARN